uniref:Ribosome biogenesis protein BRX1 homolog n=1 Tax=Laticauda laticaudata TaxID=8630 RepID=A0A8C5RPL7_LATLA
SSRGINFRTRHLMKDLRTLMPHSKADTKMDRKDKLFIINEVCEMKNCNKCIFFEAKKKQDLYIWLSNVPHGPSAKFLVQNIHTLAELKMTGNCLRGSRPVLSFDPVFDQKPHYALLKELFIQVCIYLLFLRHKLPSVMCFHLESFDQDFIYMIKEQSFVRLVVSIGCQDLMLLQ